MAAKTSAAACDRGAGNVDALSGQDGSQHNRQRQRAQQIPVTALALYSGQKLIGFIDRCGARHVALDADGSRIGEFATMSDGIAALSNGGVA